MKILEFPNNQIQRNMNTKYFPSQSELYVLDDILDEYLENDLRYVKELSVLFIN